MESHRGHALRRGRHSEPGRIYLVTTVTHQRARLFDDWQTGRLIIRQMMGSDAETLAFVIMPDHLHWLLTLGSSPLERVIQSLKSRSGIAVNRHLGRTGAVWQHGYHDHALRKDEDMIAMARYIVANPLRANLVCRLGDYPLWDAIWL